MNTAIIVAAGNGKRFGDSTPKQFLPILGKPLINLTLERFEACDLVDEIILVVPKSEISNISDYVDKKSLKKLSQIVEGGKSRAESALNGFKFVNQGVDVIAIHDGVRPLVSVDEISETIEKAIEKGAACLVAPVTETIKKINENKILKTIDRTKLRKALTPQCFRYKLLQSAFEKFELGKTVTDESSLVEKLGYEIATVEGSTRNVKITTKEDFLIAEAFFKEAKNKNV